MTTTTVLAGGGYLGYATQAQEWHAYIDEGGYTSGERDRLVAALMAEQEKEFGALLPPGCGWFPHLAEIIGPAGTSLEAALAARATGRRASVIEDVMDAACERVTARFTEIEHAALGRQP